MQVRREKHLIRDKRTSVCRLCLRLHSQFISSLKQLESQPRKWQIWSKKELFSPWKLHDKLPGNLILSGNTRDRREEESRDTQKKKKREEREDLSDFAVVSHAIHVTLHILACDVFFLLNLVLPSVPLILTPHSSHSSRHSMRGGLVREEVQQQGKERNPSCSQWKKGMIYMCIVQTWHVMCMLPKSAVTDKSKKTFWCSFFLGNQFSLHFFCQDLFLFLYLSRTYWENLRLSVCRLIQDTFFLVLFSPADSSLPSSSSSYTVFATRQFPN